MSTDPQRMAAGPNSPCTKICALDAQGYCIGCLRTGEEIARWTSMTAEEQWLLLAELDKRRRHGTRGRNLR